MSNDENDLITKGKVTFKGIRKDPDFVKTLFKDADAINKKRNKKALIIMGIWFGILLIIFAIVVAIGASN